MEEEGCTYCLQVMTEDRDPRKLDCGHVFCLECLHAEMRNSVQTDYQCPVCRLVQSLLSLLHKHIVDVAARLSTSGYLQNIFHHFIMLLKPEAVLECYLTGLCNFGIFIQYLHICMHAPPHPRTPAPPHPRTRAHTNPPTCTHKNTNTHTLPHTPTFTHKRRHTSTCTRARTCGRIAQL